MTKNEAIRIEELLGALIDLRLANQESAGIIKQAIHDALVKASSEPTFFIGAYKAHGEEFPVLVVMLDTHAEPHPTSISPVARRGEPFYTKLMAACYGKPVWLYGQTPQPLT